MKKTELMRRLSGSDAGFTLIELMIVVAIIGILVAVAIPNFLRAMDKARYNRCLQALSGLKIAEEMYISDNNRYADDANRERLGMYMIPSCTAPAGCGTAVADRIGTAGSPRNCRSWVINSAGFTYDIRGTATDRNNCHICVTPTGFAPEKYDAAGCAAFVCP